MVGISHPSVAVAAVALSVALAVRAGSVPLSPRAVLAAAPWTVVAGAVAVAGRAGVYDAIGPLPATTLLAAVAGLGLAVWILFVQFAALRGVPHRERYLAAAGIGAGVVLLGVLFVRADGPIATRAVWLAVGPVAAALLAAVGYFALGLVYTDALSEFGLAGLYAVAAVVFDGVASAVVVEVLEGAELAVVTTALRAGTAAAGIAPRTAFLLPAHLLVGVAAVAACGWLARERPAVGYGCALAVSAGTLSSATTVLFSAVFLG